jgi:molybdopterin converting factor small subunit
MIRVLFFGATATATGTREITLEKVGPVSAGELIDQVSRSFPALESYKLLFAVNQAYADDAMLVRNGDEFAIFTAVSGG